VAEAQPAQVKEEPAEEGAEENPQPAAASPFRSPLAGALEDACRSAFEQKHYRDALNSCTRAFAARPEAAELAVLVARMELDRGRISDARTWAQKATDVDPNLAEAYVFLGTAEQQAGHAPAARVAYMRYLELAPHGRHAQDLRAILSDL
jgi:tetratricopeptide (TPR) repeat protein